MPATEPKQCRRQFHHRQIAICEFIVAHENRTATGQPSKSALHHPTAGRMFLLACCVEFLFADAPRVLLGACSDTRRSQRDGRHTQHLRTERRDLNASAASAWHETLTITTVRRREKIGFGLRLRMRPHRKAKIWWPLVFVSSAFVSSAFV